MALYIMVRHRRDKRPNVYTNRWKDDLRLESITTETFLAELLEHARATKAKVYVHRCSGVTSHARIACAVRVTKVDLKKKPHPEAAFEVVDVIDRPPRPGMRRWKIHYVEEPPEIQPAR